MARKIKENYGCPVDSVKIGPFDYEIRWLDDGDISANSAHGQCEHDYQILYFGAGISK